MKEWKKVIAYVLVILFVIGIFMCCEKSVKFFTALMKQNNKKLDIGLGYTPPSKPVSNDEE